MKFLGLLLLGWLLVAGVALADTFVNPELFMRRINGAYELQTVGGLPVHENNLAEVVADTDEATFSFPYCGQPGICDPGYYFFPYATTTVVETKVETDYSRYEIAVTENNVTSRFTWEFIGKEIYFTNNEYHFANGTTAPLEFVAKPK